MFLNTLNPIPLHASKHHREHNQAGIWLHSWLHPNGNCDLVHQKYHREAHWSLRKLQFFRTESTLLFSLPHLWMKNGHLHREISSSHLRNIFPSFFMVSFGFDIYAEEDKDEILDLEQCIDWVQHYVQPGWAGTDRNFTCSSPQMEATKLASASSSPAPSGP